MEPSTHFGHKKFISQSTYEATVTSFEILFLLLFTLTVIMNVIVVFKYKVYNNSSSMFIMGALIILNLIRIISDFAACL